jgi:hypothetical protein
LSEFMRLYPKDCVHHTYFTYKDSVFIITLSFYKSKVFNKITILKILTHAQ